MKMSPNHISGASLGVGTVVGVVLWLVILIVTALSLWLFDFAIQAALHATGAVIGGLVQVVLFSFIGWGIYRLVNRKKFQAQAALQDERRTEFESWLSEVREKRKHKEERPTS